MSKSKSTKTTASGAAAMATTTSRVGELSQPVRRVIQNYVLVWFDANFDESDDDFKKSLQHLRKTVASIATFTNVQEGIVFLNAIKKEKIFMIVSGSLGQQIVPEIEAWPRLESIYVFCGNREVHEQWARKIQKVKGVHTSIEPICDALQVDRENCDRAMIPISFNGIDTLFMYTQLLKEIFLDIEDDDTKLIKELAEYCRLQNDIDEDEIAKVEQEYHDHTPIWWYTAPFFMNSVLNCGLRLMDVDIVLRLGFFIRDLHQYIDNLYQEQQSNKKITTTFTVFRGQGLSVEVFEKMKKTEDGLMSFNNFLLTSENRQVSLQLAREGAATNSNMVGILFIMTIDPTISSNSSIPYVDISREGFYEINDTEILFTTHTIFRIDHIQPIPDDHTDRLWQVNLTLVGNDNPELDKITSSLREEFSCSTGWSRLGHILIQLGEPTKAEQLYKILLEKTSSDEEISDYNQQLGRIARRALQNCTYQKFFKPFVSDKKLKKLLVKP
ncbi:unnamed protein product [Rotaria sp. Silwood1]|nr:unnamed protein product [Rotaria sp. Silwood1]